MRANASAPAEGKYFVEVGTSNFNTLEKLAERGWRGMFIEPVRAHLDGLEYYPTCAYENVAVDIESGEKTFVHVDPEWIKETEVARWHHGLGSLRDSGRLSRKDHLTSPLSSGSRMRKEHPDMRFIETEVRVERLDTLFSRHGVTRVDFLKTDTEGHDLRVLQSLDLNSYDIRMIKAETSHIGRGGGRGCAELCDYLRSHDFMVWPENADLYAIR